jgi:OOP family OmpA-OmpF porin
MFLSGVKPIIQAKVLAVLMLVLFSAPVEAFYSLHVHSYRKVEDAAQEVQLLREAGLDAFSIYEGVSNLGLWHRVYIGRYATEIEARALAEVLTDRGVLSKHSNYKIMWVDNYGGRPVSPSPTEVPAAGGREISSYRETVEGSYVGSYRTRFEAERQAEGLTLRGWPAYVTEGDVWGVKWYRVYLSPDGQGFDAGTQGGFEILVDLSHTYENRYSCLGLTKYEAMMELLDLINLSVPDFGFQAALRTVGHRGARYTGDYSRLMFGVEAYSTEGYDQGIDRLRPSGSSSPLGWGITAVDADLSAIGGRKALIIISDFRLNRELGRPADRALALSRKYGPQLCLYTIYLGADRGGVALARDLALTGECGNFYDGCALLADQRYFNSMIREIFYGTRECPDADRDGVCDDVDLCPDTPLGAMVDERGCWIAAFAQYFDFDKAEVKKKYLPNIRQAADILNVNPNLRVVVAGHTDDRGSYQYNMELGAKRAEAVRKWLIRYGVSPNRLGIKSYGETRPIASNKNAAGRARNRRVEFEGWPRKKFY